MSEIKELIARFRKWEHEWDQWAEQGSMGIKPDNIDQFSEKLSREFKIEKR